MKSIIRKIINRIWLLMMPTILILGCGGGDYEVKNNIKEETPITAQTHGAINSSKKMQALNQTSGIMFNARTNTDDDIEITNKLKIGTSGVNVDFSQVIDGVLNTYFDTWGKLQDGQV